MTETKMKIPSWMERPRANRLASIIWPGLADEQARRDMDYLSKQEGKRSPTELRGGQSKPTKPTNYRR